MYSSKLLHTNLLDMDPTNNCMGTEQYLAILDCNRYII